MSTFYSKVEYVADGSTQVFHISFPYLNPQFIDVYVAGVQTEDFEIISTSEVRLDVAPADGNIVQINRTTPLDRRVDFQNSSLLDDITLNEDSIQMLHITQEAYDRLVNLMSRGTDFSWDAEGARMSNLADPVNSTDAMNFRSAKSAIDQAEDEADRSKQEADKSKVQADKAETEANRSTAEANRSRDEANKSETQAGISKDEANRAYSEAERSLAEAERAINAVDTGLTNINSATTSGVSEINATEDNAVGTVTQTKDDAVVTVNNTKDNAITDIETHVAQAEEWASNPEDHEVELGLYSAYHYMQKTREYLVSASTDTHGNEQHTSDYETISAVDIKIDGAEADAKAYTDTHEDKTTGVHGVGTSTIASQAQLDSHAGTGASVHGVGTTGIASKGEVDSAEASAKAYTDSHESKSNPHSITTSKIGAETPAGAQSKADDAESGAVASAKTYTDGEINALSTIASSGSYSDLINVPTSFNPSAHNHSASEITSGTLSSARLPDTVVTTNLSTGYEIRKNGTDGAGIINFKT